MKAYSSVSSKTAFWNLESLTPALNMVQTGTYPLIVAFGPAGSGKSAMAADIADRWLSGNDARSILYTLCFGNEYESLVSKRINYVRSKYKDRFEVHVTRSIHIDNKPLEVGNDGVSASEAVPLLTIVDEPAAWNNGWDLVLRKVESGSPTVVLSHKMQRCPLQENTAINIKEGQNDG